MAGGDVNGFPHHLEAHRLSLIVVPESPASVANTRKQKSRSWRWDPCRLALPECQRSLSIS